MRVGTATFFRGNSLSRTSFSRSEYRPTTSRLIAGCTVSRAQSVASCCSM